MIDLGRPILLVCSVFITHGFSTRKKNKWKTANCSRIAPDDAEARKTEIDLFYEADTATRTFSLISPAARSDSAIYDDPLDGFPVTTQFYEVDISAARYDEIRTSDKGHLQEVVRQGTLSTFPGNPPGARISWPHETGTFRTVVGFASGERFGLIRVLATCETRSTVEILTND